MVCVAGGLKPLRRNFTGSRTHLGSPKKLEQRPSRPTSTETRGFRPPGLSAALSGRIPREYRAGAKRKGPRAFRGPQGPGYTVNSAGAY